MPSIRISETEILDASLINAFEASEQSPENECVLTIGTTDGRMMTVRGETAEAALMILRLHGF